MTDIGIKNLTRRLVYLDLAIPCKPPVPVNKKLKYVCNFQREDCHHEWHNKDNPQLNTVIDLIINLSEHLHTDLSYLVNEHHREGLTRHLQIIRENLDNIKDTVQKIESLNKEELQEIGELIARKPKPIELETKQIITDNIKIYKEETDKIIKEQQKDIKIILEAIKRLEKITLGYE